MMASRPESYEPDVLRVLQTKEEIRHYYNKISKVYDLLSEHSEQPMRERALALLAVRPGETALEIGFGTGHCLVELANSVGPNGRVRGIDMSDEMVRLARELLEKQGLSDRAELTRADAASLPYEDASTDAIFMSFTLELFDTPEIPRVLNECKRVLKPNGRLGVAAVSREGTPGLMVKAFEWTHRHIPNLMDCRPIYTRRALEAAGYQIRASEIESMWVPVEIIVGVKA